MTRLGKYFVINGEDNFDFEYFQHFLSGQWFCPSSLPECIRRWLCRSSLKKYSIRLIEGRVDFDDLVSSIF